MDKELKQFIKSVKEIKLSKDDKSQIKHILQSNIFNNPANAGRPVSAEVQARHIGHDLPVGGHDWSKQSKNKLAFLNWNLAMFKKPMPIFLMLALLISGGLSASAENALPTDVLYPVKTHINERVRGWLAVSHESEADWQAQLMGRRLNEAEKLASEGILDADTQAELESDFQTHAEKAEKNIALGDVRAGAEINSKIESSLDAHEKILDELRTRGKNKIEISPLLLKVKTHAERASNGRNNLEQKLNNEANIQANVRANIEVAADNKLNEAQNKIDQTRELINDLKRSTDNEAIVEAQTQLRLADQVIYDGKMKMEAKEYGQAFILFQKAHRIAQEAKLILKARRELKLNVKAEMENESENEDESNHPIRDIFRPKGGAKIELEI